MTEEAVAEGAAASTEPAVLYTAYFSTATEVVEAIEAADRLGLGVRVESYSVTDRDNPDGHHAEFEFTLLSDMPARPDDGEQ